MSLWWWENVGPQRVFPVPVKEDSGITSWGGWPDDVRPTLEAWNHKGSDHSLSFRENETFKCSCCADFCRQHNGALLDGEPICDTCLIAYARIAQPATDPNDDPKRDTPKSGTGYSPEQFFGTKEKR